MSNNLRISSPWSQLAIFLGIAGASMFIYAVLANALYFSSGISGEIRTGTVWFDPRAIGILKWGQTLSSIVVFGIPAYCYAKLTFRDGPIHQLGLRPAGRVSFYLLGIVLLLISLPLVEWLGELNKAIPLPGWMNQLEKSDEQQITSFLKIRQPFDPVINLVVMAALPAFCEELFFRGVLQRILIHISGKPWLGILLSGFLFSFFHLQFQGFMPRWFLGILLGAACWYSGSLWVSVLAHFFYNAIVVSAAMFYPVVMSENPPIPIYAVLISILIVVGLLYRMHKQSTVSYARVFHTGNSGE
jgi:membrane protease YdiL (CAAX protease family)